MQVYSVLHFSLEVKRSI